MTDSLARIRAYSAARPFGDRKRHMPRIAKPKLPKGAKKRLSPEFDLHVRVVVHLKRALPNDALVFHVPNERKGQDEQASQQRIRFARMGVMPGAPDLMVVCRGQLHCIELKSPKGSTTDTQDWAHGRFHACGVVTAVCRSIEEVDAFLIEQDVPIKLHLSSEARK